MTKVAVYPREKYKMITGAKEWCERLNIPYCEYIEPYYERGVALYRERGDFAFNGERIVAFNDKYSFMRRYLPEVLECSRLLYHDEDMALFVYVLAAIYEEDKTPYMTIDGVGLRILEAPDRGTLITDMAPIFSSFYFLDRMVAEMEGRGVPHKIISDSMNGMDTEINDYVGIYGRPGMKRYIAWYLNWVRCLLYRIGRFQFKPAPFGKFVRVYRKGCDIVALVDGRTVHRKGMCLGSGGQTNEDEAFLAEIVEEDGAVIGYPVNRYGECECERVRLEGYTEVLREGDMIIEVHIPAKEPMTPEICEESYRAAEKFFRRCYPEYDFKAFTCQSWMLEKRIPELLGKETNLTKFMDGYEIGFPMKSGGEGVYSFVFNVPEKLPPEELPEDTSLRRAIKKHLTDGGYIYEKGGIRLL